MQGTKIVEQKKVKPYKPIMVVGLPGVGYVGRLVALHLIKQFKAEKFAVLYSDQFPYEVIMTKKGTVRIASNRFYLIKRKRPQSDIIVLTGDVQALTSEGQYLVNTKILDYFKSLGGSFIYTLGGYSSGNAIVEKPRVFGNATSLKVVDSFKKSGVIFGKTRGSIVGSAGLIVAFAKAEKLDGICLMGESSFLNVDANAAKSVLLVLSKNLGLKIDTAGLDSIINKTAQALKSIEEQAQGIPQAKPFGPGEEFGGKPSYIR
ncbi:MAG: proteasome assembly chaperone family protein [Candidatus Micrarchaeaceae archaeon]